MKLVFYINYLNHHQVALTDELYRCLGNTFACICTQPKNLNELKGGKDYSLRSYHINATDSQEMYELALSYAREADVCIFGADSIEFAVERARNNKSGISFEVGERWFKKGFINMFSPRFIKWIYCYYRYFRHGNFYRLCASAYAAKDVQSVGAYINRCFKWGYFVESSHYMSHSSDYNEPEDTSCQRQIRIMWCARYLNWKHPELPVKLAAILKQRGYDFVIDMFGSGVKLDATKKLAERLRVADFVRFPGNRPNEEVLSEMRRHDIFLFTSDRNEGWGVVLNEAMTSGCAVVASDEIGAVPYLIRDGINGRIFKSRDLDSLENAVVNLLDNPAHRKIMAQNAMSSINEVWSPSNAISNLLQLVKSIDEPDCVVNLLGPCQPD